MLARNWFFLFLICDLSLQAQKGTENTDALDRAVTIKNLRGTSADAVSTLLVEAEVPGGVVSVYDNCARPTEHVFSSPPAATLRQALDYVSTVDHARTWAYRDGVIIVGSGPTSNTILGTVLGEVTIEPTDSLSLATQKLLESKEMKDKIRRAGLVELNTPLGLYAVRRADTIPSSLAHSSKAIQTRGKTLEQALNVLASSNGMAAWHYEQFGCAKKTSFRVSWLIH
jgi:hypothetical protein